MRRLVVFLVLAAMLFLYGCITLDPNGESTADPTMEEMTPESVTELPTEAPTEPPETVTSNPYAPFEPETDRSGRY